MAATITLNVVTKDEKALAYLEQLAKKADELKKPITLNLQTSDIEKATTETKKFGEALQSAFSRITSTVARRAINETYTAIRNSFREALTTMKAVDTELTNIQKVSGMTSEEIRKMGDAAYETAAKYGVAADEYLSAVYTFQKAGLGDSAEKLGELATKTMLVGDTTATVASKFLISANAAWQYGGSVERLSGLVDEADWINNNYATDLQKLSQGLPIVASVAAQAGLSAEETLAALGTIQSVTQESGTKSATAFRALILNILGETGEFVTEEGEAFQVTEESVKSLHGVIEKYAGDAIAKAKESGGIIDVLSVIRALAEASKDELSRAEIFEILSGLGGKLRTNQLTALVQNTETLDKILGELGQSAGTADKEISLMMGSWEKKAQNLKTRWTQFIAGLVETDEIKGLVDDLTEFVANLDPERVGGAIRGIVQPIIDLIKNTDWAEFADKASNFFDKASQFVVPLGLILPLALKIGTAFKTWSITNQAKDISAFFSLLINEDIPQVLTLLGPTGGLVVGMTALIGGAVALGKIFDEHGKKIKVYEDLDKELSDLNKQYEKLTGAGSELADLEAKGKDLTEVEKKRLEVLQAQAQAISDQIELRKQERLEAWNDAYGSGTAAPVYEYDENGNITGSRKGTKDEYDLTEFNHQLQMARMEYGAGQISAEEYRSALLGVVSAYEDTYNHLIEMRDANMLLTDSQQGLIRGYEDLASAFSDVNEEIDSTQKQGRQRATKGDRARSWLFDVNVDAETKRWEAYTEALHEAAEEAQDALDVFMGAGQSDDLNDWGVSDELISQMSESFYGVGTDAAEGLAEGMAAGTGDAAAAATAMGDAVEDTLRDRLDTHSPSGVTEAIGEDVGHGLSGGLESTKGEIQNAAAEATRAIGVGIISQSGFIQDQIARIVRMAREFVSGLMASSAMSYHWGNGSWVDRNGNFHTAAAGMDSAPGGPTLVNELGPELISENGRAYIAGGGKPAVVNLSPGAIVIPADQTAEALRGGMMPRYARAQVGLDITGTGKNFKRSSALGNTDYNKVGPEIEITSGGGSGGSGASGRKATVKVDFSSLESKLSDLLNKIGLQIELAENEGDYPRVVELYEQAQEAVADLVEKYRKAGYADDSVEILTLLNKNYEYANKQLDIYRDKWDDLIAALEADTDATKAAKELEEKRLALEEAQAALANAQKQRTVRFYNASTGQWEWIADEKQIQSAQESLKSAEENYADEVKSQAIAELEAMRDTVSDLSDIVLGPALSAVVTMAESSSEFQTFARALDAVFGVGSFLQSTEGSTSVIPTVDSHDTHYSFGGVSLTDEQAGTMTLKQLAQMLQVLKITD